MINDIIFISSRYLEQVSSQSLPNHHETVVSMIQEVESRSDTPTKPIERLVVFLMYEEQVSSQSLSSHHDTVVSMIQEVESR